MPVDDAILAAKLADEDMAAPEDAGSDGEEDDDDLNDEDPQIRALLAESRRLQGPAKVGESSGSRQVEHPKTPPPAA